MNPDTDQTASTSTEARLLLQFRLRKEGTLTVTLDRPEQFNALSHAMLDALQEAVENADSTVAINYQGAGCGSGGRLSACGQYSSLDYS